MDVTVPDLVRQRAESAGDRGRAWLSALPSVLDDLAAFCAAAGVRLGERAGPSGEPAPRTGSSSTLEPEALARLERALARVEGLPVPAG